ncbi:hypothetical protein LQ948_16155 [Jiella sp. MQZ9-1]|nr:hypothetical protein [Jiella flava]
MDITGRDRLRRAQEALKGIIDMLVMVNQRNLHLLAPDHLSTLLELVSDEVGRAQAAFDRLPPGPNLGEG